MAGIDFVPPPTVSSAIISGMGNIVFLHLFSLGPLKVISLGKRFLASALTSLALWCALLLATGALTPFDGPAVMNLAAGAFIIAGAISIGFTYWSLLSWSFTFTMLVDLAQQDSTVSLDEWMTAYGGGTGLENFFQDRLELIFRLGIVKREDDEVKLTPVLGNFTGHIIKAFYFLFAIQETR